MGTPGVNDVLDRLCAMNALRDRGLELNAAGDLVDLGFAAAQKAVAAILPHCPDPHAAHALLQRAIDAQLGGRA